MVKYKQHEPSHEALHKEALNIAKVYFRLTVCGFFLWVISDFILICKRDWILDFAKEYPEFTDLNEYKFFELEEWIQTTVLLGITGYVFLEILFTRFLKYAITNESTTSLQIWFALHVLDCAIGYSLTFASVFFVSTPNKMTIGIIGTLCCLIEIYFFKALRKYYKSLLNKSKLIFSPTTSSSAADDDEFGHRF